MMATTIITLLLTHCYQYDEIFIYADINDDDDDDDDDINDDDDDDDDDVDDDDDKDNAVNDETVIIPSMALLSF